MRLLELLGLTGPLEEPVEKIKLDGPFIPEDVLVRKRDNRLKLLCNTLSKCNLIVFRDLLVFSKDFEFAPRDDCRIQIGLNHHIHQIELSFTNSKEYEILAIDRFVILNPSDAKTLKEYLNHHLPTEEELKHLRHAT
jgi:hypothetical protein